jgi:uncharacterized protein
MADARDDTAPPRRLELTTADGVVLEGEASLPVGAAAAVLLAHPHPAQGGSMRSLVTSELFRILPERGVATLRFNFRGVEGSGGHHSGGVDEHLDIEAGLDLLAGLAPGLRLFVAGWSFGADVALTVGDERLAGWCLIAPPLRSVPVEAMVAAHDPRPKLLVVGEHDQFRPPASAQAFTAHWVATEVVAIAGADHFFAGRTDKVAELVVRFAVG